LFYRTLKDEKNFSHVLVTLLSGYMETTSLTTAMFVKECDDLFDIFIGVQ